MPRLMTDPAAAAAFAEFLQAESPRALGLLRRLCPAEAEDLLQETLARVWRYRDAFDPARNGGAWLLQAAFRTFLDHRRRTARAVAADDASVQAAAAAPALTADARDELAWALGTLLPLQRALLLGFHAERLSLRELAARHGLPLNTVKSHLHRARRRLMRPAREGPP